jgi:hypothetical protein
VVDLSGALRDFPAVHGAEKIYVGYESAVLFFVTNKQGDRFLTASGYGCIKAGLAQGLF